MMFLIILDMNMRYTKIINLTKIISIRLANLPVISSTNFNKVLSNKLTNTPSYKYSTLPPKIQRKGQKVQIESGVQKIIKQLDNLKKHEQLRQEHMKTSLALIERSTLSASQKLSCKKYMTSIIYHKNQPTQFLLQSQTMKQIHKDQPFMEVETYLYIISRQQSKQAPNYMLINDLYMKCFEDVLKKAQGDDKWKIQALLYKNFGKYMIEQGNKEKGSQSLQKSIDSHITLIKSQSQKTTDYINKITQKTENNSLKQKPQKQREILKLNAMKQNTRRLIESMYETLYYYYNYNKYKLKDTSKLQLQQQTLLITFISLFSDVLKCSGIVQGSRLYSRHYHKLRQIYFQLEYAYALGRSDQQRKRDIVQKMNGFIKQCMNDVQETKDYVQVQKNIVSAMFSIKLHLSRQDRGKNIQAIKKDLTDMAITIIQKSSLSQSKITKQVILKILAQFIKKNLN